MKQALLFFLCGLCLLMPVSISANAVPKQPARSLLPLGFQSTVFNKKKIKPRPKKSFIHQQKSRSKRVRKRPMALSPIAASSLLFIGLLLFVVGTVFAWIFLFGNVAFWLALGTALGAGIWGLLLTIFAVAHLDHDAWNDSALFEIGLTFFYVAMLANLVACIYGAAIGATLLIAGMLFLLIPLLAILGFVLFLFLYVLIGGESLF